MKYLPSCVAGIHFVSLTEDTGIILPEIIWQWQRILITCCPETDVSGESLPKISWSIFTLAPSSFLIFATSPSWMSKELGIYEGNSQVEYLNIWPVFLGKTASTRSPLAMTAWTNTKMLGDATISKNDLIICSCCGRAKALGMAFLAVLVS